MPSGSSDSDDDAIYDPEILRELRRRIGRRPFLLLTAAPDDVADDWLGDDSGDEATPGEFRVEGTAILLNGEDAERVRRLAGLGFNPAIVAQVYEACGRDEAVTQQCLLSGGFR
jgi:hypothetical protein